jgi:hypothetical protein
MRQPHNVRVLAGSRAVPTSLRCDVCLGRGLCLGRYALQHPARPDPPPPRSVWEAEHLAGIEQVKEALSNEAERAKKMR